MELEEAQEKRQAELEEIRDYSEEEILENLESSLEYTDIIVSGYQFTEQFSEATAIMFAGICKLRACIENAMFWIENQEGAIDGTEDNTQL